MSASPAFRLREATQDDLDAVDALYESGADGGAIAFRRRRLVPEDQIALGTRLPRSVVVIAEEPGRQGPVGAARTDFGRLRFAGAERPVALARSLIVDPAFRRRGIAAAMTAWLAERAEAELDRDAVMVGEIQQGNTASLANARRWAGQVLGPLLVVPAPMRRRPPRTDIEVGIMLPHEAGAVAEGLRGFSGADSFARLWEPEELLGWLSRSPLAEPIHHYLVARENGRVVAGMGLREEGGLITLDVVRMPPAVRAANLLLHVVPRDGRMRNVVVDAPWFAPGQARAGAALWEHARWAWRERGSGLLATVDARSPARQMLGLRPWSPTTAILLAVRSRVPLDAGALLQPPA